MDLPDKHNSYNDNIPAEWTIKGFNKKSLAKAVERKSNIKSGLFSSIPLVCRGSSCPYGPVCYEWSKREIEAGERCIPEIANIINYTIYYKQSLKVKEDNFIDLSMIRDLVSCDIIIDRAYKLLSMEDMVIEMVLHVDEEGVPTTAPAENVAQTILEKQLARKHKTLSLMNATPKDRLKHGGDESQNVSSIMIQLKKALQEKND